MRRRKLKMVTVMNAIRLAGALALALLIAACGTKENPASANGAAAAGSSAAATAKAVYSGTGTVQSVTGDQVAIAHGPISGIGWPAMTMTFTAPGGTANGIKVGDKVDFSFRQTGSAYVLTSVKPR